MPGVGLKKKGEDEVRIKFLYWSSDVYAHLSYKNKYIV